MDLAQTLATWPLKDFAGWTASAATMAGAVLTAANLGSRVTGWGFVSFTIGSIAWTLLGFLTQEQSLLITNAFLAAVNAIGIWRWLGHKARYEQAATELARETELGDCPTLLPLSRLTGAPVADRDGEKVGSLIEAMVECRTGRLHQVVIASTGANLASEDLRTVKAADVQLTSTGLSLRLDGRSFSLLPVLDKADWTSTEDRDGPAPGRPVPPA